MEWPLKKRTASRPIWYLINEYMAFPPLCSVEAEQARNCLGHADREVVSLKEWILNL